MCCCAVIQTYQLPLLSLPVASVGFREEEQEIEREESGGCGKEEVKHRSSVLTVGPGRIY